MSTTSSAVFGLCSIVVIGSYPVASVNSSNALDTARFQPL